jgi:hypothetical protein
VIEVDERDWPLVRIVWSREPVMRDELEALGVRAERAYARGERMAIVVDTIGSRPLGPRALATVIALERRHAPLARPVLVARAIVVESEIAARMLDRVLARIGPAAPSRAFHSASAADRWAREQLGAAPL